MQIGYTSLSLSLSLIKAYNVLLLDIKNYRLCFSFQHDVQYVLESSNPVDGTQFFYLNPSTGVLTVSRPLTETVTQTFTVSTFDLQVLINISYDTILYRVKTSC